MRDFTFTIYKKLLVNLIAQGYSFYTFSDYLNNSKVKSQNSKVIILRHDVDRLPANSLLTAKLEKELGIKGTYYFRIVPKSFNEKIILQIAELDHEIGYHYEEMDNPLLGSPKVGENNLELKIDKAYELFKINLEKLRSITPVKTICMHGSPLSKYDNKLLWTKYDYRELEIIGEPYLDLDWHEFEYLTDTGRRWDGVSVRDKAPSSILPQRERNAPTSILPQRRRRFRTTFDIINYSDELPKKLMITVHPERWSDNRILWTKQLIWQSVKNLSKYLFLAYQNKS